MTDDAELRRRSIDGLAAEVAAFAAGAPDSHVVRRDGVVAGVTPAVPDRSLFNAVHYRDAGALGAVWDELAATYDEAGVRAWAVWVPDDDRAAAELLAARDHALDSTPRLMALWLPDLAAAPPAPEGVEAVAGDAATAAALNDRAYGYEQPAFRAALAAPTDPPLHWAVAARDGEPAGCVAIIEVDGDCCVTGVATAPGQCRRGIAAWLLHRVLEDARRRGLESASLQAARVYARLGFRDLGFVELWERRSSAG